MGKLSFNPDHARSGGGIDSGIFKVNTASFKCFKTDYKDNILYLHLGVSVLDGKGNKVRGADDAELSFGFGTKSIESFHPGNGTGPNDDSPEDLGTEIDTEGNTIYTEGGQANKSCAAVVFSESLVKCGFPKEILAKCWAPHFIGLKFALATYDAKTINEKIGTRLSTKPLDNGNPVTYKICEKILNPELFDGMTGDGANNTSKNPAAKPAKAKETSVASAASAAATVDPEDAPDTDKDLDTIVKKVLTKLVQTKKGKIKNLQALGGFFTAVYLKSGFPKDLMTKATARVKDESFLTDDLIAELGGVRYEEDGQIEFF